VIFLDAEKIAMETEQALEEVLKKINLKPKEILVVGCSTSEVIGETIGTGGSINVAEVIMKKLIEGSEKYNILLAIQCCEHLNRALVVERETMERYWLDEVQVIPRPCAGGTLAAHAMEVFDDPVVVEYVKAHGGIDIGQTLIGMHLKHVAVPTRITVKKIGEAVVTCARTRPKLIGGERAVYKK
jgi:uncharacterized protein (TIGR01440 family)